MKVAVPPAGSERLGDDATITPIMAQSRHSKPKIIFDYNAGWPSNKLIAGAITARAYDGMCPWREEVSNDGSAAWPIASSAVGRACAAHICWLAIYRAFGDRHFIGSVSIGMRRQPRKGSSRHFACCSAQNADALIIVRDLHQPSQRLCLICSRAA